MGYWVIGIVWWVLGGALACEWRTGERFLRVWVVDCQVGPGFSGVFAVDCQVRFFGRACFAVDCQVRRHRGARGERCTDYVDGHGFVKMGGVRAWISPRHLFDGGIIPNFLRTSRKFLPQSHRVHGDAQRR
jgi:hypothetical protein